MLSAFTLANIMDLATISVSCEAWFAGGTRATRRRGEWVYARRHRGKNVQATPRVTTRVADGAFNSRVVTRSR
jgi:hypothetical protein